jgi:hypothetical protein
MSKIITSEVLAAYSLCPQKAFLLLCTEEKGTFHEYEQILQQQQRTVQNSLLTTLVQTNLDIRSYTPERLSLFHTGKRYGNASPVFVVSFFIIYIACNGICAIVKCIFIYDDWEA